MRFPPANLQLRRAQLVLMLATLVPTVLLTGIGIVLLAMGQSTANLILGVLVLALCGSGITGYVLGSIFVGRGASLVRVQNDFLSSVSHELRTPLTSIKLFIESLRDGRLEVADRAQVLSLLGRETERLEHLVGRLLDLQRLSAGRHIYAQVRVDLADVVEEAVAVFDAATLSNPTPIVRELEPGLYVIGDRATLVRAIANLLHNSWKYSGDDKQIAVLARAIGRKVEVVVRDNGIGIPHREHRTIFEQFGRGRAATELGAPGVGLGLAFVRAIVRGHRGKIDVVSRPGHTELQLKLRRAPLIVEVAAPTPPPPRATEVTP